MNISVAGTGYVGMSIATLLAQHNEVTCVDVVPERVDLVNNKRSPIQDDYIEDYLANKQLNLKATLDQYANRTALFSCRLSDKTKKGLMAKSARAFNSGIYRL